MTAAFAGLAVAALPAAFLVGAAVGGTVEKRLLVVLRAILI